MKVTVAFSLRPSFDFRSIDIDKKARVKSVERLTMPWAYVIAKMCSFVRHFPESCLRMNSAGFGIPHWRVVEKNDTVPTTVEATTTAKTTYRCQGLVMIRKKKMPSDILIAIMDKM